MLAGVGDLPMRNLYAEAQSGLVWAGSSCWQFSCVEIWGYCSMPPPSGGDAPAFALG